MSNKTPLCNLCMQKQVKINLVPVGVPPTGYTPLMDGTLCFQEETPVKQTLIEVLLHCKLCEAKISRVVKSCLWHQLFITSEHHKKLKTLEEHLHLLHILTLRGGVFTASPASLDSVTWTADGKNFLYVRSLFYSNTLYEMSTHCTRRSYLIFKHEAKNEKRW